MFSYREKGKLSKSLPKNYIYKHVYIKVCAGFCSVLNGYRTASFASDVRAPVYVVVTEVLWHVSQQLSG